VKIEIEAKVRVDDLQATVDRLGSLDAQRVGQMHELNIFLDSADRHLYTSDRGLRIRMIDHEDGRNESTITYKGPRRPGKVKNRREIEFQVSDEEDASALFAELGYVETIRFEKRRTRYRYDGCVIELDELPHLGTYVEIEGPDEKSVIAVLKQLGLSDRPLIKSSYVAMLQTYLDEHGVTDRFIKLPK
jgi:predicted adenylyl cyclase CyaB